MLNLTWLLKISDQLFHKTRNQLRDNLLRAATDIHLYALIVPATKDRIDRTSGFFDPNALEKLTPRDAGT